MPPRAIPMIPAFMGPSAELASSRIKPMPPKLASVDVRSRMSEAARLGSSYAAWRAVPAGESRPMTDQTQTR
jgi:hypothetical protein